MKLNINFLQTGGIPLTADLMSEIMSAIQIFDAIGSIAGNYVIIQGCETIGRTVDPGVVWINGEFLPFVGGLESEEVFIQEESVPKVFQSGEQKILITKKTVRFGLGENQIPWTAFTRLKTLRQIATELEEKALKSELEIVKQQIAVLQLKTAPIINGGIVLPFRKPHSEIPAGWKECTDFRGKVIVGWNPDEYEFRTLMGTVGAKTHSLTADQNGPHTHTTDFGSEKIGSGNGWWGYFKKGQNNQYSETSRSSGLGEPHNNIQPSRIALFIEPNFETN